MKQHGQDARARTEMHRKSAYILFLAVLTLLVIGIVMLFSTSAFARDAHGDVGFFIKRGILAQDRPCRLRARSPRWSIIISGNAHGGSGLPSALARSLSASPAFQPAPERLQTLGRSRQFAFNRRRLRRSPRYFFSPGGFRILKKTPAILFTDSSYHWASSVHCWR
jgi:hypothetical protein